MKTEIETLYDRYYDLFPYAFRSYEEGFLSLDQLKSKINDKTTGIEKENIGPAEPSSPDSKEDDDENDDGNNDEDEIDPPDYPNMPNLPDLKSDFQLLDYSDFSSFLSAVYSLNNSLGENFSCEDLKEHTLETGSMEPPLEIDTEDDFVKNTREVCKISYLEYMISRQMEYISCMGVDCDLVIMSKEYFLYMFNICSAYYDRTNDERYYDSFIEGRVYGLPILISKYSKTPLVVHNLTKSDPGKDISDCKLMTNSKIIETFTDVFNDKGRVRKESIKAEDLIQMS